jgi:5'-phosphate synthase pdxT subunit
MTIGVLALQGDFKEHLRSLAEHGVQGMEIRSIADLQKVDALILPGGESTTMAKLLLSTGLDKAIRGRVQKGMPIWGTCAGAILLAKNVISPLPLETTLGLLDMTIERNSYGRQAESFIGEIQFVDSHGKAFHDKASHRSDVFFIRSPRIIKLGRGIKVLARYKRDPVLVQKAHILASTFHSELGNFHG